MDCKIYKTILKNTNKKQRLSPLFFCQLQLIILTENEFRKALLAALDKNALRELFLC